MPTGRHHPRLSPFSFPHDFKTSPRFRSERNHSTLKIHPRLPPFSLCTILKSPPVPTLKIHPRLSPFSFAHDFETSPRFRPLRLRPRPSASILNVKQNKMALFLILQRIEPFTAGFSFEPFTASFRRRWLFFSYSRTSTILVIFVPKKLLFHLIPFIYRTPENRTFRPENGSFSQSTHSSSCIVFVGFFGRIHDGKPLRLRPRPSATISQRQTESPIFQKSGSLLHTLS